MTRKEYYMLLEKEVYTTKSKSFYRRLINRFCDLYLNPSHHAVYLIRKMQYTASQKGRLAHYRALWMQKRLLQKYGMHISPYCKIGEGFHLPHPLCIVIGTHVVIGSNCSVYQGVTLGGGRIGDVKKGNQPTIGNNVTIFTGAMILGRIIVDDDTIIAANSVVLKSTEGSGTYAGTPAKKIK